MPDLNDISTKINVTWKGNGESFAVSFVGTNGRGFKVFDREGTLQCTSEKMNDLDCSIAWRPSGSWIAIPQKQRNKSIIALFEKNGLKHREIVLPFDLSIDPIIDLKWNVESDILAIATETSIYLYIIGNYHWYLKQCLKYDKKIKDFTFDTSMNEQYTLHVILENGVYDVYKFKFDIDHSYGESFENQGIVAVIDGKDLYLTDFRNNLIPPPMFSQKLSVKEYINSCGFLRNPTNSEEYSYFFSLQQDDVVNFHKCIIEKTEHGQKLIDIELLKSIKLELGASVPHNLVWLKKDLLCFCSYESQYKTSIKFINLDGVIEHSSVYDGLICATSHYAEDLLAASTQNETLVIGPNILEVRESVEYVCEKVESFGAHIVALKSNSHLYVSGSLFSDNVTSFDITTNFLVFTQFDIIKFVRLSDLKIVEERRLERGGKIVITIPSSSRTILQMPRGNLEGRFFLF